MLSIIKDSIYENIWNKKKYEKPRYYLGFSQIGQECSRYLWLDFHKKELKKPFSEKQAVIFENGHWAEKKLIQQMRDAGLVITDQQMEMSLFDGLFMGHPEGLTTIKPYGNVIFEIKELQKSDWNKYKKYGVEVTSSTYYAQAIMLAGYLGLPGTYWIAENKDNQDLYEEWIPSNITTYNMLCSKAERILYGEIPKGVSSRRDFWKCFNCQFNHDEACRKQWEGESPF